MTRSLAGHTGRQNGVAKDKYEKGGLLQKGSVERQKAVLMELRYGCQEELRKRSWQVGQREQKLQPVHHLIDQRRRATRDTRLLGSCTDCAKETVPEQENICPRGAIWETFSDCRKRSSAAANKEVRWQKLASGFLRRSCNREKSSTVQTPYPPSKSAAGGAVEEAETSVEALEGLSKVGICFVQPIRRDARPNRVLSTPVTPQNLPRPDSYGTTPETPERGGW